ncbi:hypothetical protein [Novosphingobium mangrovi (ex Huang et al. 2023)]|uniref:Porin domain-containing protein n=1 Tax=Novosphingobium mangrovi (ex Huang et al. 2023) TaxID=2976432 RepID=A0ABT2IAL9_9SPHN|nr:hypothetical protein [Novosphingobium mangrovi (ex Huang et al. 2023)]MCT2401608.1 hypothetical protein [Novosphingobium mangrovi (ex Huang et al. 2023)]
MVSERKVASKGGTTAGVMLAACVGVLALPSAVMAFSTSFSVLTASPAPIDSFDPDASPENLSHVIAMRSLAKGQPFPFTPAGTPNRPDRSVTVAVRVDPEAAKAIIVHGPPAAAQGTADSGPARMRMPPTAFNLGISRGYQNFAQDLVPQTANKPLTDMPDLRKFSLQPGPSDDTNSRFSTRLSIDEKRAPGRAPRTFAGEAGEVDLSGAYRVTNNLDVTAGVRYSQERERLRPLTDGKQDSQSVYVGTQFHF